MALNRNHPDFDMALELLVMLPPEPGYAFCTDLCIGLDLTGPADLGPLIRILNERGHRVRAFNVDGKGRAAQIDRDCWGNYKNRGTAQMAAQDYWAKVHQG